MARAVRRINPNASARNYIDVIENTFRLNETGKFAFRLLCQQPIEKLSEFL